MKRHLIKFIKMNPILYRIAKRFYRKIKPAKPTLYQQKDYWITCSLTQKDDIKKIIDYYKQIKKDNYRLLILVESDPLEMHQWIQNYPSISFLSMDYYKMYHKKLNIPNMIYVDWRSHVPQFLEYL